jgi:flagellin-like hook-associated protein FlgL
VTDTWNMNGIDIALVAENTLPPDADAEWAEYDATTNQVLVHIHPDATTAEDIMRAINHPADPANFPPLQARLDPLDTGEKDKAGQGTVPLLPNSPWVFGTTTHGTGQSLDREGLQIENGGLTHVIDFSHCENFGDLLNEINDPTVGVKAEINEDFDGLDLRTRISGTDFTIGENGGETASQLGIRSLDRSTKLEKLDYDRGVMDYQGPGTNAEALYQEMSADSAMILRAKQEGEEWNGYTLEFAAHSPPQDDVTVSWDETAKTITIGINPGTTQACEVVEAFNQLPGPKEFFTLELDTSRGENSGEGVVYAGSVETAGGDNGGTDFYITRKDGVTLAIDLEGCQTVDDVLQAINDDAENADDRLVASLAEFGNGIELTDLSVGTGETTVRRAKLSTAAIDLGLIPSGEEYETTTTVGTRAGATVSSAAPNSNLIFRALSTGTYANDVSIVFEDAVPAGDPGDTGFSWDSANRILRFEVNDTITTANDIIALFENNATEELKTMFEVVGGTNADGSPSDGTGVIDLTDPLDPPMMDGGEDDQLKGTDPNPQEANSLFTAMIRLQQGLESGDLLEIERAVNTLDEAVDRINFARAELGVRQEGLDTINARLDDEEVNLRTALSETHEVDLSSLVVQYTNQQISYQASLQATSKMFQLSLVNYL